MFIYLYKQFVQACMAGIVFAKFTKPTNRAETILFSTNALITLRNGSYYLLCRIGDMRWAVGSEGELMNYTISCELCVLGLAGCYFTLPEMKLYDEKVPNFGNICFVWAL